MIYLIVLVLFFICAFLLGGMIGMRWGYERALDDFKKILDQIDRQRRKS